MGDVSVSIVIPTYNRIDTLKRLLASIFRQNYTDYEIIVVDDCSTDRTLELLEREERLSVISTGRRQGPSHARNRGIRLSRGTYIWFLDSDVVLPDDDLLERMIHTFRTKENAGSLGGEIVASEISRNRAYGRNIGWNAASTATVAAKGSIKHKECDYLATCNCFTRREYVLKLTGFDEQFAFGAEDMDFGYRLKLEGLKNYLHYDLAVIHFHSPSGRYEDETIRYQKTRVMFARKHFGSVRLFFMFGCDSFRLLIFYLVLPAKLLTMVLTGRPIRKQNLIGPFVQLSHYFTRRDEAGYLYLYLLVATLLVVFLKHVGSLEFL